MNNENELDELAITDTSILDIIIAEPDIEPMRMSSVHLDSWQYGASF